MGPFAEVVVEALVLYHVDLNLALQHRMEMPSEGGKLVGDLCHKNAVAVAAAAVAVAVAAVGLRYHLDCNSTD